MPNWVQNEIIFENASDEKVAALLREIKLATESEDRPFDFNKLIPMPESLNIESGSSTDRAIAYYVTERLTIPFEQTNLRELIHNSFSDDWAKETISRLSSTDIAAEDWDKLYELGKQYMYNREHYGCYTWYEWCIRNWGTKWNACDPDWCLEEGILYFKTAWSPPIPVVEALAEKYPDLEFTHRWADEDIGNNCGQMWYSEGCGGEMDIGDFDNDRAFAMDVWGYDADDFDDDFDNEIENENDSDYEECDPDVCDEEPEIEDNGLDWEDVIGVTS